MKTNCLLIFLLCVGFVHSGLAQCDADPVASYGIVDNITKICEGQAIAVDNKVDDVNDVNCVDYMIWDWGDGQKDTVTDFNNKTHIYNYPANTGNGNCPITGSQIDHDIKLTVVYNNGESHYIISPVKVYPKPHAFLSIPTPICIDNPQVNFSNNSCYAASYVWEITKPPSSTVIQTFDTESPSYTFPSVGTFKVKLTATSDKGCGSSMAMQEVEVLPAPEAVANIQISDFCAPSIVQLSSAGSAHVTVYTWMITATNGGMWMWADTSYNEHHPNPKVIFKTAGTYTIKLRVQGAPGCMPDEVILTEVVIKDSPIATWSGIPPNGGCLENGQFTFDPNGSNSSSGGYTTLAYEWFFPGGSPSSFSGQNPPIVTYTQTGSYDILMILTGDADPANPCGRDTLKKTLVITNEAVPTVSVSGIPANDCGPFSVLVSNTSTGAGGWEWTVLKNGQAAVSPADFEFLNGTNKDSKNPEIRFKAAGNYILKLQMEMVACGDNTTWQQDIVVKTAPTFSLGIPLSVCVPAQVIFGPYLLNFNNGNDPSAIPHWQFPAGTPDSFDGANPPPVSYSQAGTAMVICYSGNECGTIADTVSLELISKMQVTVTPQMDSLCKNGTPIQLSTGLANTSWPANAPNGQVDPQGLIDGWNNLIITNGASDPGCLTKDTAKIYILNQDLTIGNVPNFCDTVGNEQITGYLPLQNVAFSGGNYVTSSGLVSAAIAGFGTHPLIFTYSYSDPGVSCIFVANTTFSVFQLPESGIAAPTSGCTNSDIPFSFPGNPAGLSFSWNFGDGSPVSMDANPGHQFSSSGDFIVTLTITNSNDCEDQATHSIHIEAPLSFELTVDPLDECAEVPVQITVDVMGENPQWNLYVGNFDTIPNFTTGQIAFPSGIEDTSYTLIVSGNNACPSVSKSVEVLIHPLPRALLGATSLTVCSGDTVFFNWNQSTGMPFLQRQFDSGNGYVANTLPVNGIRYFSNDNLPKAYLATLFIENQCGIRYATVEIIALPENIVPFVQLSDTLLCVGDTLSLKSFATDTATAQVLQVSYHFSNGDVLTQANAKYVFTQSGHFRIVQWVTDGCNWDSLVRWVTVRPAPPADFLWMPDTVCASTVAAFQFLPDPTHLSIEWLTEGSVFGSGIQTNHVWDEPGWKTVHLSVKHDTTGCTAFLEKELHIRANPAPQILASDTIGCGSLTALFTAMNLGAGQFHEWVFSDGTTNVGSPVEHSFDSVGLYNVHLRTQDVWGCVGETTLDGFLVNPLPGSSFLPSLEYGCGTPTILTLQNLTQDALGARWFLDGTFISNQTDTTLTFETPGFYRIELVSVNKFSCTDTARYDFRVLPTLKAKAAVSNYNPCQFDELNFMSLSENADHWFWDFGNGDTSTLENPAYAFPQSGLFQVTLIARQDSFCADTFLLPLPMDVRVSPKAGFAVMDFLSNGIANGSVICTDSSSNAIRWRYDFVELGIFSTLQNPVVQYTSNFEKTIIQTVFNEIGCFDTAIVRFAPTLFGGLVIPTALQPNASTPGEHTIFRPVGAGLRTYKIEVFSPSGDLIWHSEELSAGVPTGFWDGRDRNGKECPAGAYLWKVEARLESTPEEGRNWKGMPVEKGGDRLSSYGTVTIIR